MAKRPKLVTQYLENIHRAAFDDHPELVREVVKGRNGIYALYRKEKLYYVGLAKDLRFRLRAHLNDRHKGSWDRFSVYLTIGNQHLRELESLAIRITRADGNSKIEGFAGAQNLSRQFELSLKSKNKKKMDHLMGRPADEKVPCPARARALNLKGIYKKKVYRAKLRADGNVNYNKVIYRSPSGAAKAVCGHAVRGPWFWLYERSPGDWVKMSERKPSKT